MPGRIQKAETKGVVGLDWFIADTHFGHENIITYCGRPFKNAAEMDEVIITNWNTVVKPEDTVFHLGDFAFASKEEIAAYRSALNGRIVLIMGNHDRQRTVTFWERLGVYEVCKKPILYDYPYLLSHEPVESAPLINIHGHTHGNDHRGKSTGICVSCEVVGYTPRKLKEVVSGSNQQSLTQVR